MLYGMLNTKKKQKSTGEKAAHKMLLFKLTYVANFINILPAAFEAISF